MDRLAGGLIVALLLIGATVAGFENGLHSRIGYRWSPHGLRALWDHSERGVRAIPGP